MPEPNHEILEALADEFAERLRRGESPTVAQYAEAHPELADEIRESFPSIQMMEQLALRREQQRLAQKTPAQTTAALERLGDYRILHRIGQGGMGIVYEAVHESLDRRVAVKMLLPQLAVSQEQVARFVREAQAAARLHHTNIVPVFGVGEDHGHHYYVMQLIAGEGLDRVLARSLEQGPGLSCAKPGTDRRSVADRSGNGVLTPFPETDAWQAVAKIGVQVAEALDYAHTQGTLHRDIKPANLLLDGKGIVWVADFGLAKVLDDVPLSHTGAIVGTLRYMAPEQLNGQAEARSDIYSLGLTLYELLAFRPAFQDASPNCLVKNITQGKVAPLRQVQPRVPRDLEKIVAKATAHEAADRYESAAELAADLRRFLEDRPIHARRIRLAEHVWRWGRRNPLTAALSASSLLLLLAMALLSTLGYVQIRQAYDRVDQALTKARRSEANAIAAAQQTEQERQRTQEQYARADANLTVALAGLDEISDKLASRPLPQSVLLGTEGAAVPQAIGGLSAADAEIIQSLLKFYDQFATKNAAGSVVDFATARVHHRIGDIRVRLGQYDQAVAAFGQALKTVGALRSARPTEMALLLFEVRTHNALGAAWLKSGEFPQALESHRHAQQLLASTTPSAVDEQELRYGQALTLTALVLTRSSEFIHQRERRGPRRPGQDAPPTASPEIQHEFQQALRLLDGLLQIDPQHADYRLALARCHRSILPVAWANDDEVMATTAKQQAIAILHKLADEMPADLTIQFELADTLAMTAQVDTRQPLPDTDVSVLERSLQLATDLHEKCPTAPEYAILLANVHQKLGSHFMASKQWGEAQDHLATTANILEPLVRSSPINPLFQISLARVRWELADSLQRQDALRPARELLEQAIVQYSEFRDSEAGRRASTGLLVGLYRQLARTLEQLGEEQLASEASRTADRLRDLPR